MRRLLCSITASTYIRVPGRVTVSRKSQARRASAWERRKSAHVLELRSGAGSMPASFGAAQWFLSAFSGMSPHFRPRRHRMTAPDHRAETTLRFTIWNHITESIGPACPPQPDAAAHPGPAAPQTHRQTTMSPQRDSAGVRHRTPFSESASVLGSESFACCGLEGSVWYPLVRGCFGDRHTGDSSAEPRPGVMGLDEPGLPLVRCAALFPQPIGHLPPGCGQLLCAGEAGVVGIASHFIAPASVLSLLLSSLLTAVPLDGEPATAHRSEGSDCGSGDRGHACVHNDALDRGGIPCTRPATAIHSRCSGRH